MKSNQRKFPEIPQITQARRVTRKRVVIMGKTGSGKTTIFRCLTHEGAPPWCGLETETQETIESEFDFDFATVKFFDTVGLMGQYSHDKTKFEEMVRDMSIEEAKVDIIFITFAANRFTTVDQNIVNTMRDSFTESAKAAVHVIVTHCAQWKLDELRPTIIAKFHGFGDLEGRISCVNLPDPRDADTEDEMLVTVNKWAQTRERLLEIIRISETQVSLKNLLRSTCFMS